MKQIDRETSPETCNNIRNIENKRNINNVLSYNVSYVNYAPKPVHQIETCTHGQNK